MSDFIHSGTKQNNNNGHTSPHSGREAQPGKSKADAAADRRREFRSPFTAAAIVMEPRTQTRIEGRCSDLSLGGCYVDTLNPLPVGAIVRIRIDRNARRFEAGGTVAYSHFALGMGLKLNEMGSEDRNLL